jgi:hypothetical protein
MALDSNEYIRRLQEKYPIGNCEHFPHMRVLTQAVGGRVLYLELTLARIQIWSNYLVYYLIICFEQDVDIIQAMERDGVTLQVPPNSVHFDAKACMKPPKTANAVDPVIAPEGQNPAPVPQAQVQPAAYPPFPSLDVSITLHKVIRLNIHTHQAHHISTVQTITIQVLHFRITRHSHHLVRLSAFVSLSRTFVPVMESQKWTKQNWPPSSINPVIMLSSNSNVQIGRKLVSHRLGGKHFWMLIGTLFAMLEPVYGTIPLDSLFYTFIRRYSHSHSQPHIHSLARLLPQF